MPRRGPRAARGAQKPKRPKHKGLQRHGGARAGAGRKKGPVPWHEVERAALAGGVYEEIVVALEIKPEVLQNRAVQERLRSEVERGNAKYKLRLRQSIKRRGMKGGSVNSLALMARNSLGWDQQFAETAAAPDLAGVGERLSKLIEQLAKRGGGSAPPAPPPSSPASAS